MEQVLIVLLASLCTVTAFALGQRHGLLRLLSPMHLVAYFCFFGFWLKAVIYTFMPDLAFYRSFVANPWGDQLGALYLGLFVLLLCLGYRMACRSTDHAAPSGATALVLGGVRFRHGLFALALAVTLATIAAIMAARGAARLDLALLESVNTAKQIAVNADGVGATLAGIKTLFIIPKFVFVLLLAQALVTGQRGVALQALVLALVLVLVAVISGDRFELVELLVYAGATGLIVSRRIGLRAVAAGALACVLLAAVYGVMTQLRLGTSGDVVLQAMVRQVVGSTYFLDFNTSVMVTDRVTTQMMLFGESYFWWLFGWVPRAVWPDKPAIDLGVFFKRDVMQVWTGGAFNVTGPGEAFINFGWAGALAGFVLGWVYRRAEAALLGLRGTLQAGLFLLYPLLLYPFIQATLQSSFSAFIVGAMAQMVPVALLIWLCVPRYALRPAQAAPKAGGTLNVA